MNWPPQSPKYSWMRVSGKHGSKPTTPPEKNAPNMIPIKANPDSPGSIECKAIRSQYFRTKRRNKRAKTTESSNAFKKQSKEYKKTRKKAFKDFTKDLTKKTEKFKNLRS